MSDSSARSEQRIRELLRSTRGRPLERAARAERAVELAAALLSLSRAHVGSADRQRAEMLARMMHDPPGQQLTSALTDRLYRSRDPARVVDQVAHLLRRLGTPRFMRLHERLALQGVRALAPLHILTGLMARETEARVRTQARDVLLDAAEPALARHLSQRHQQGVRVNVNQLGEALLGEREAEQRVRKYVALATRPGVDALSVKVSSIASQLNLLAFEQTLAVLCERLAQIYRATLAPSAPEGPLVMLDMEAYAHVELTLQALFHTLAQRGLDRAHAGVVLQAYLPDAHALLTRLQHYASARRARGGAPMRLRIVKGANLAHERVESAKAGSSVPIYASKLEVDASYKRLLENALTPTSCASLRVGVASHNLFDLAYALLLREERELDEGVELELLEGMAEPVQRTLSALGIGVLVYAPICGDDELNSGIAYLVRRLDENTARENYLRASFEMTPESPAFAEQRARFLAAISLLETNELPLAPRRAHDAGFDRRRPTLGSGAFTGEADTDFSQAINRAWLDDALDRARHADSPLVQSVIAGLDGARLPHGAGRFIDGVDPSRPFVVPYRVRLADAPEIERALACAAADPSGWSKRSLEDRSHALQRCAAALRGARVELIASMVLDGGKRAVEADVEVSEAIDFAEYYRTSFAQLLRDEGAQAQPRGVVLVTPPWNFPLAIPAGGVLAALMAGCRVLFKPALETALVGAKLATLLHAAGIPESALQLLVCADEEASALVRDARVDSVILTGATSTARLFQALRPGLRLLAETGGKNAYIVSALSDRELAIRDAVQSAFGHAGQKCSAASLLICEREVYEDAQFRETLRDAVQSLPVGASWSAASFVTPLIHPPEGPLARALSTLEPGESWLVEPHVDPTNPRLVSPGVKLGVAPGSFTHTTELFGPVLGVMCADSVAHAVQLANATGYGLTAGLASLDEREQAYFREHMRAGNLYINRTITGAIVRRQPFGGIAKSGFGPGAKAGGPNYVTQLCHLVEARVGPKRALDTLPHSVRARAVALATSLSEDEAREFARRAHDYARAYEREFAREHDPSQVLGQHNHFRYRACDAVLLRVEHDASALELASSVLAASLCGARTEISLDPAQTADASLLGFPLRVETRAALLKRAPDVARLRLLGARAPEHDQFNRQTGAHIADEPVLGLGRFELLHYLIEQSVSLEAHRYGHLTD